LEALYSELNSDQRKDAFLLDAGTLTAPLPRAYQWLDGSAYLSHVERVRRARGAEMPPEFRIDPLMYQGCSDPFLSPREAIVAADEAWGLDFEAEVAVITDEVPMGITPLAATTHIKLVLLVNDISLRNLISAELPKGFGFVHGKPPNSASPVAVTLDALGSNWQENKLNLPLTSYVNGKLFGQPNAGSDMQFDFAVLIAHAAKTRPLCAGTIIGSGTVSNHDATRGFSCIVEQRMQEIIEDGAPVTPFLRAGDHVCIEMHERDGQSIFGAIEQAVVTARE
jgi:fumarylacetoacetate (FAA) hydrolase